MSVNKYTVNLSTPKSGYFNIDIPINMTNQIVDQDELVQTKFVDVQTQEAINPIVDYEKIRYLPLDINFNPVTNITYQLASATGATTFADLGFINDDIYYGTSSYLNSYLELYFYDNDNPMTQNLLFYITLYCEAIPTNLLPDGQPASQVLVNFTLQNPYLYPRSRSEGYYLYDYRDEVDFGSPKYVYMRAAFKNAKDGSTTNMMVTSVPQTIDNLVHQLYTRFLLLRTNSGYFYIIDDAYHGDNSIGPNNVKYTSSNGITANVTLYKIKAL